MQEMEFWESVFMKGFSKSGSAGHGSGSQKNQIQDLLRSNKEHSLVINNLILQFLIMAVDNLESKTVEGEVLISTQGIYRLSPKNFRANQIYAFLRDYQHRQKNNAVTASQSFNTNAKTNNNNTLKNQKAELEKQNSFGVLSVGSNNSNSNPNSNSTQNQNDKDDQEISQNLQTIFKEGPITIAGAIKNILHKLDPPLIPYKFYKQFIEIFKNPPQMQISLDWPTNSTGKDGLRSADFSTSGSESGCDFQHHQANYHHQRATAIAAIQTHNLLQKEKDKDNIVDDGEFSCNENSLTENSNSIDQMTSPEHKQLLELIKLFRNLKECNRKTLILLINHWHQVTEHKSSNKMGASNLGICLAPSLLRAGSDNPNSGERDNLSEDLSDIKYAGMCIEFMIENCQEITCQLLNFENGEGFERYREQYLEWRDGLIYWVKREFA